LSSLAVTHQPTPAHPAKSSDIRQPQGEMWGSGEPRNPGNEELGGSIQNGACPMASQMAPNGLHSR